MRMRDIRDKVDAQEDRVDLWLDQLASYDRTARLLVIGLVVLVGLVLVAILK